VHSQGRKEDANTRARWLFLTFARMALRLLSSAAAELDDLPLNRFIMFFTGDDMKEEFVATVGDGGGRSCCEQTHRC